MNNRMWMAVGLALALGTAGVFLGRAMATGVPQPTPLTWAGVVTDQAGKPYPQAQDVTVGFWDKATGGTLLCKSATVQAEGGTGRFQATLPAECAAAVHATPDLWSEAVVGAGKAVMPRVKVGAVPYALEADVASKAGGGLKAQIEAVEKGLAEVKGAPAGGGGGPKVVDAKGQVVGYLLQQVLDSSAMTDVFTVVSSKGYQVRVRADGKFLPQGIHFDGANCTGKPYLAEAKGTDWISHNKKAVFSGKLQAFYVIDGPPSAVTMSMLVSSQSQEYFNCIQGGGSVFGWLLKPATLTDIGLPPTITGPLTITP